MESDEEALRLELKTDSKIVENQALWAGIKPGMQVADIGCGSGKTTAVLHKLVQPAGRVVGFDFSEKRCAYARQHYQAAGLEFRCRDITRPLPDPELYDFIWVRFVLEYYLANAFEIVKNLAAMLKPGGILCLVDLDNNCLNHYGLSARLEKTLFSIMAALQKEANFDPHAGKKLYTFLYDLGFEDIKVDISAHHLIFGDLKNADAFNWLKKVEIAPEKINYRYEEYAGGYAEFLAEFKAFFNDPRRFTYSPLISCRGIKPA